MQWFKQLIRRFRCFRKTPEEEENFRRFRLNATPRKILPNLVLAVTLLLAGAAPHGVLAEGGSSLSSFKESVTLFGATPPHRAPGGSVALAKVLPPWVHSLTKKELDDDKEPREWRQLVRPALLRGAMNMSMNIRKLEEKHDTHYEACRALHELPPPALQDFERCVAQSVNDGFDSSVPGATMALVTDCWCAHGVGKMLDAMGCCDSEDFAWLCEVECKPDCESPEAKKCIEECPALCIEPDYAPPGCAEGCSGEDQECHRKLRCITAHAETKTAAGEMDRICDDLAMKTAGERYTACEDSHPRRDPWQRLNTAIHCACSTGLGQAARDANCCGAAGWGETICQIGETPPSSSDATGAGPDVTLKQENGAAAAGGALQCTTTAAQCGSPEVKECQAECQELCGPAGFGREVTKECWDRCLVEGAPCRVAAAACPPSDFPEYNYVCDAPGEEPDQHGCCGHPALAMEERACPLTCTGKREVFKLGSAPGKAACVCTGCPDTREEQMKRYEMALEARLHTNGAAILHMAATANGLKYPTGEMEILMDKRNEKIMALVKDPALQETPAQLQREISEVNRQYLLRIDQAAKGAKAVDSYGEAAGSDKTGAHSGMGRGADYRASLVMKRDREEKEDPSGTAMTIMITGAVIGVLWGVSVCLGYKLWQLKKQKKDVDISLEPPNVNLRSGTNALARANDQLASDQVVLGRPVGEQVPSSAAAAAGSGAAGEPPQKEKDLVASGVVRPEAMGA